MRVPTFVVGSALVLSGATVAAAPASADAAHRWTCTGTAAAPGVLAGTYHGDVLVEGLCAVDGGAAVVDGNLVITPGSALNATFARNDVAGQGASSLKVRGNVVVESGAVLAMGCEPEHAPCTDDPSGTSADHVLGNLYGAGALGVIVHASKIHGNVEQHGGGGGAQAMTCTVPTSGVFAAIGTPVFSDYEDTWIGGGLTVSGLHSCWFGALRDTVTGNIAIEGNQFGDPDATEVDSNKVFGDLDCRGNSPAAQFGDAPGLPNQVKGYASGECGFDVLLHDPVPNGPLTPISVKA